MTTEQPNVELLPCPFCGGEVNCLKSESRINPEQTVWKVECWDDDCPANTSFDRKKDAITAWNTRADLAPAPQSQSEDVFIPLKRIIHAFQSLARNTDTSSF